MAASFWRRYGQICDKQVTVVSFCVDPILAKFKTLNYCTGRVESKDIIVYIQSWDDVKKNFSCFHAEIKVLSESYAHCRVCQLIIYLCILAEAKTALRTGAIIHSAKIEKRRSVLQLRAKNQHSHAAG